MSAVGGSIQEVTLFGRTFGVAADADASRKLGGFTNEVQANGDGYTGRLIKTMTPWSITGLTLEVDDSRGDQEYLQDLADLSDYFPISVTFASGKTYQGRGQIVDELATGNMAQTGSVALSGPGKLTPQS